MARRKKHADGRGRPWPAVKMGFKVDAFMTTQPTAVEKAFVNAISKVARHFHLDGVQYATTKR